MKVRRRADAPRLIEWTGERCVPWSEDVQVVYEHLHRYLWAAELVTGRRVLDLASGEGFGAAILSETAAEVVGCDIDLVTVEHATVNYEAENLSFTVGDARRLHQFEDGSFGAVVAFELLEHLDQQDQTLDEIKRVLAPDGLLIFSTPDRDASTQQNPYHVHELARPRLQSMLEARFREVAMFGQRAVTGSELARLDRADAGAARGPAFFIERDGDEWRAAGAPEPVYLVAVASDAELPALPDGSSLADAGIELVRRAEAAAHELGGAEHARAREQLREEFEQIRDGLEDRLKLRDGELSQSRHELERLRARSARDSHTISSLDAELNAAHGRLRRVEGSVTWQLFQRVRDRLFSLLGGEDSRAVAAFQATLRSIGRRLRSTRTVAGQGGRGPRGMRRASGPVALPEFEQPVVSIVIPLYAHAELTRLALHSIREHTEHIDYEVILVDDAADSGTKALLNTVSGARVIVNQENIGYLRSVKRGAAAARGRWLVLANNDIEVKSGWLAALLDCGESAPDVAIVAPKYLAPDGRLSEAGGVIWNDGTGCNYGRTQDPSACDFQYRREIDYGSAAALLVRTDFWNDAGGFDERFLPMYYEDTDLCFEARARGLRVLYEPTAQVIHAEGSTAGVDESASHKRHQADNRPKFVEKWRDRLESEHLPPDADPWLGANFRPRHRVLVADNRVPMWDRESGALRMRGMLEALTSLGCHVSFLPDNSMPMQPYTRELQRLGIEVLYGVDPGEALTRVAPSLSLAILSRPEVAARWLSLVRGRATGAQVVYDTVDLHWLREARQAASATGAGGSELLMTPKVTTTHELELGLIRASDATLVVSDAERAQVLADVPEADVVIVPNVNPVRERVPGAGWRSGVVFVGGFEHPPNVDGALMLVRSVMPHVWRELPDVPVTIVGAKPPAEVRALESPLVSVAGWVADLDPLLDLARALVAPLTFGAGLKGKVTQALSVGLPVVTTSIGAEGLAACDGEQMLIADDPEGLAARTIAVLTDDELWARLSRAGQALAAERCSPALMTERMKQLLALGRSTRELDELAPVHARSR
jgi:GT2 family glycosyltransferase/SAM-dependent methyltransferase/glycosyltransferase involved in cell wall biosynthesis